MLQVSYKLNNLDEYRVFLFIHNSLSYLNLKKKLFVQEILHADAQQKKIQIYEMSFKS